jgi:hypothetical protein
MNWLLLITEYIFHFNPFLIQIGKRIRLERELQFDLQVMNYQYDPIAYAETLLKTAMIKQNQMLLHLSAFISKSELQKRITFFTNDKNLQTNQHKVTNIGWSLGIVCLILGYLSFMIIPSAHKDNPKTAFANHYKIQFNNKPEQPFLVKNLKQPIQFVSENPSTNNFIPTSASIQNTETLNAITPQNFSVSKDIQTIDEHFAIPVAAVEVPKEKLMFIEEQDPSTGLTLTKAFLMKYIDGEWKMSLLWIMNEFKPLTDSCGNPIINSSQLEFDLVQ